MNCPNSRQLLKNLSALGTNWGILSMKTILAFAVLTLVLIPLVSESSQPSEVLFLDKNQGDTFLVSNSFRDGWLQVKNNEGDTDATVTCGVQSKNYRIEAKKTLNLKIPTSVSECLLEAGNHRIRLIKDEVAHPILKEYHKLVEDCDYQKGAAKGIDKLFLTNDYPMMTCAHPSEQIKILSDSEEGLLTKIEALLGTKPPVEFIRNQNPYAELDFSKAPKLDAIFISTLLYRHDFSGTVVARLLKHHAKEGTIINIIGTGYMHEEKDKELLRELSEYSPNIRVQEFTYQQQGLKSPARYILDKYRDMHVKMFVTLSKSNPENNVVITGGRNIHDGFVYSTRPDFSKFPELDQVPEGPYAYWNDLEIKITSEPIAKSVYAHLLKLWNREVVGQRTDSASVAKTQLNGEEILRSSTPMMRHVLSLPYNDDHALEKLYVEMIDSAQSTVKISSPYLRPTKPIMEALERAIKRNVDVVIQTRIDLAGDTQAWLYEETNKAAINSLYQRVKVYEWIEQSILHTKTILIDGKFAFFGSVNLSRRSFLQDVESGFIIHSEEFVGELTEVFENYNKRSRLIAHAQKKKFWANLIMTILQNEF